MCFETYNAGALGGAFLSPALVEDAGPGMERRDWTVETLSEHADSLYFLLHSHVWLRGEWVALREPLGC